MLRQVALVAFFRPFEDTICFLAVAMCNSRHKNQARLLFRMVKACFPVGYFFCFVFLLQNGLKEGTGDEPGVRI